MRRFSIFVLALAIVPGALAAVVSAQAPQSAPAVSYFTLDFEYFRTKVQPIFLAKREGHARCISCHAAATGMRLVPLPTGATTWNEADSRTNFDNVRRMVAAGSLKSRLLLHPLATEAGGDFFHNGGKHFTSQNDPEWTVLKDWVMGAKAGGGH